MYNKYVKKGVPHPVHGHLSIEPHFLECIPATGLKARPQRKCVVCEKHRKRKESIYWCSECEAGLCLDGCFNNYCRNLYF
jgi:hypothetical protein